MLAVYCVYTHLSRRRRAIFHDPLAAVDGFRFWDYELVLVGTHHSSVVAVAYPERVLEREVLG